MKIVSTSQPRLRLRVTQTAESLIRSGHPWLFSDSVREQNREGVAGELAVIYDKKNEFLAIGLYDPDSPIRLRVLHKGKPLTIDAVWWKNRVADTFARREGLFDAETTGYRLINGESDGWPGLVLDRYDTTLVLKIYSSAWFTHFQSFIEEMRETSGARRMVLRLSRNIFDAAERDHGFRDGQILFGSEVEGPVIFLESGLRFEADVIRGQKTGFFLDQRENRRIVETLSKGRRVLNAFSFSGGFSLYSARGGAISVASLDESRNALEGVERHFELNQANENVAKCRSEIIQADAFAWFQERPRESYDLIILDPPSLAKREADREEALRVYGRLAASGVRRLSPGGMLTAASCSAHVGAAEFFEAVREAARVEGKDFVEWKTTAHAPDHPARLKEGEYLTCIYLKF
ncbi:MAG: class I SAM-dependent methyltransferase [Spirochaetia bacterium]|nr:class I SAM-dependent methyltransferase [Spirochaetia bacterium]